ncbi:MAG TPA: DUF3466 family protein [Chthoniobacterales bacterium]|nr:DUF3466 family protein [Chthoniobacterales bacterium]
MNLPCQRQPLSNVFAIVFVSSALFLGFGARGFGQSHWEVKPSNTTASLNGVVFGNGLFVAVGDNGVIVTSPNGDVWTPRASGTTNRLPAIAYGNGRFVATRENRTAPALTSPDGVTWTPITVTNANGAPAESTAWKGIAFGQGRFLTVGDSSVLYYYADILRSDDGVSFKVILPAKYPEPDALTERIIRLSFFRDRFYGLLENGWFVGTPDGVTWKGSIGSGVVMASDGSTKVATVTASYGDSTFSVDAGHTLGRASSPLTKMNGACYGAGRYVAVDYQGRIWSSETDGEYWRPRERYAQNGEEFRAVAFNGVDRFVAVGSAAPGSSALIAVATADPPIRSFPGSYTVYSLKDLTKGVFGGQVSTISNTGIIGGSILNSNNASLGAIIRDGVVTTYPDPVSHSYPTVVTSVNDSGSAALNVNLSRFLNWGVALPQQSRTFPTPGLYSTAASINANGWITGSYRSYDGSTRGIYRYNSNTDETIDLGNLGLGGPDRFSISPDATSINEWGDIAGRYVSGYLNGAALATPFRLSANGQLISIPLPSGAGYVENIVINSRGDVAGSTDLATQGTAFLFKDGVTTDIDVLKSEGSAVRGMNNKDEVVGYFEAASAKSAQSGYLTAFLYQDDAMYDLNRLLDASGDGWVLEQATAINDDGTIVGEGLRHGASKEPFLAIRNAGKPADVQTRFVNVSTRLRTGTGDDVLIGGFIISGGPKRVVVRALGPALKNLGNPAASPPNLLPDPTLELLNERGERIAFNDNFTDLPYFSPDRVAIESSRLVPPYPDLLCPDSVITALLPEGHYTAIVRGKDGTAGNCLVEIYNVDTDYTPGLLNISTRGPVGNGDDVMIAGFIIRGDRERRVLIRGVGPSLAEFGVANPLQDPTLEIHDQNGQIAQNDAWRSDQETEIVASGLAPKDNREAAVILSLWPGAYTAILRGKDNSTGNGLVEVYALP